MTPARPHRTPLALALSAALLLPPLAWAHEPDGDHDGAVLRGEAALRLRWEDQAVRPAPRAAVKLLAINDFHGQLSAGKTVARRPVGSAPVLAAYLEAARAGLESSSLVVHAGDHVGASPASSALLQDEPSVAFLNQLANRHCRSLEAAEPGEEREEDRWERWLDPRCDLVGTLGNHELDEGIAELRRLLGGGNHAGGPFLEDPWRGARYPTVAANVVDVATGMPVFPPFVVKEVAGVRIAFVGAVLQATPSIVTPTGVAGLAFLDEAEAVNRWVPELLGEGVRAIVVLLHQGGTQDGFAGPTGAGGRVDGPQVLDIVSRLHGEVDLVISGHAHGFTNALVRNAAGREVLLTQAFSAGTAYADIDLEVDRETRDVVAKSARIVTTWADEGPGLAPEPAAAALTAAAEARVAPLVKRVVARTTAPLTRTRTAAGESSLGDLIADAQRAAMGTDFAFMNPGGIRADLPAGDVTWGDLFAVQPFGNVLVKMTLTGAQIRALLEQQWAGQPFPRVLQISGLDYAWDAARPPGSRVREVRGGGRILDPGAGYTVTVNSFLAAGGDNYPVLRDGTAASGGPLDLDALVAYLAAQPQPIPAPAGGRIAVVP